MILGFSNSMFNNPLIFETWKSLIPKSVVKVIIDILNLG